MAHIDYEKAKDLLAKTFLRVEHSLHTERHSQIPEVLAILFEKVFSSKTQAYREVLLGCLVTRILERNVDIRSPYVSQGPNSFNGRDLDEKVINPFLKERHMPSSRGPYLGVFRRQVKFVAATRDGLRDKSGYDAFLGILTVIENEEDDSVLRRYLCHSLYCFVLLREESHISLARIHRVSLYQYRSLIEKLLATPSGGLMPVLLVVAMFRSIKDTFGLAWEIDYQRINVSDRSSGAGGDVTISREGKVMIAIEVTERSVDKARVLATFRAKIVPQGIEDYVFLVNMNLIEEEAVRQAEQYFAQGHEVNFVDIRAWLENTLVTVGSPGRASFNAHVQQLLSEDETPKQLKAAWNAAVETITSV